MPMQNPTHPEFELLRAAYAAFNARDIDAALALLAPDVAWPKAFTAFHPEGDGRILVDVHQVVRDKSGAVLADMHVGHRFHIRQGLIQAMEVGPAPASPI